MRLYEIATRDLLLTRDMRDELTRSGYKFLGSGVEHSVWVGPDGYVYKIMPPRYVQSEFRADLHKGQVDPKQIYLTKAQRSFIDWVQYCQLHQDNQFLPYFDDWQTHVRENKYNKTYVYIQARTERLFPFKGNTKKWAFLLSIYVGLIRQGNSLDKIKAEVELNKNQHEYQLMSHIGEDGLNTFYNTVVDLAKIAKAKGYNLDLHRGNFMLGSDGHIVINDPFFIPYDERQTNIFSTSIDPMAPGFRQQIST